MDGMNELLKEKDGQIKLLAERENELQNANKGLRQDLEALASISDDFNKLQGYFEEGQATHDLTVKALQERIDENNSLLREEQVRTQSAMTKAEEWSDLAQQKEEELSVAVTKLNDAIVEKEDASAKLEEAQMTIQSLEQQLTATAECISRVSDIGSNQASPNLIDFKSMASDSMHADQNEKTMDKQAISDAVWVALDSGFSEMEASVLETVTRTVHLLSRTVRRFILVDDARTESLFSEDPRTFIKAVMDASRLWY